MKIVGRCVFTILCLGLSTLSDWSATETRAAGQQAQHPAGIASSQKAETQLYDATADYEGGPVARRSPPTFGNGERKGIAHLESSGQDGTAHHSLNILRVE